MLRPVGWQKRVYGIAGRDECYALPAALFKDQQWTNIIESEQYMLDYIISLGLLAQAYTNCSINYHGRRVNPQRLMS